MVALRAVSLLLILAVAGWAAVGVALPEASSGASFERLTLYHGR